MDGKCKPCLVLPEDKTIEFMKINFMANLNLMSPNIFVPNGKLKDQSQIIRRNKHENDGEHNFLQEKYAGKFSNKEWMNIIKAVNEHQMTIMICNTTHEDYNVQENDSIISWEKLAVNNAITVEVAPNGKIQKIEKTLNRRPTTRRPYLEQLMQQQKKQSTQIQKASGRALRLSVQLRSKSATRRSSWSLEQLLAYRRQEAQRAKERRQHFTEQQLLEYRRKSAAYNRAYRARLTEEQTAERRRRHRERAREKRAKLTEQDRGRLRMQNAQRKLKKVLQMTPQQLEEHRRRETLKHQEKIKGETDMERALRLSKMAKRAREKYAERKSRLMAEMNKESSKNELKLSPNHKRFRNSWANPCICVLCHEQVPCKADLRQHFLVDHNLHIPFSCGLCWKSFKERNEMMMHRNIVHRECSELVCNICSKQFKVYQKLLSHTRVHLSQRSIYQRVQPKEKFEVFICNDCRMIFLIKEMFEAHQLN